ncbi:ABC transporter I family member 11, chloroplastic isoform X2 [Vigna angularis]|uniref:ABC transporter I family member 11, chloroplastic isoform X2 n=1 Tax=Phaseolus angularis TaxID=3914 RepID=UPI0022B2E735|nr:ABC transporter I family member 11, chloroplastic isoform X2 [Vigna angularis]
MTTTLKPPIGLRFLQQPPFFLGSKSLKFPTTQLPRINCSHSSFEVREVSYQPPGTQLKLLNSVSFSLPEKSFGLIFGQSGSGKTTLLQEYANQPRDLFTSKSMGMMEILVKLRSPWCQKGLVLSSSFLRGILSQIMCLMKSLLVGQGKRVGLSGISLDKNPHSLSGGYKRRLALAIQLVQTPDLLILDEPLAGLDWKARADVVKLLKHLKKELTVLVVSHDLREFANLVDRSWRMEMGGNLKEEFLPL